MFDQQELTGWRSFLPIADWGPSYDRSWLTGDFIASLTVWALLVPEAMAYASLAGMPPETGLYTAPLALGGYAIFGTSKQLNVGPSSTVAVMSASVVTPIAMSDPELFISLTNWLAIVVGVILIVAGLLKTGFIADFMSKPVLDGFIVGLALIVAAGQLHKLFGFETDSENFFEDILFIIRDLDMTNVPTLVIGVASLALLFLMEEYTPRVPAALTVTFLAIIAVGVFDPQGVEVIGEIPAGLENFGITFGATFEKVVAVIPGALGIVIVGFAESVAAARSYANKYQYEINPDQEMIALVIFRFDADIFFANANALKESIRRAVASADPPARVVLIDAESVNDIDSTGMGTMVELREELAQEGVEVWLARVKAHVLELLERYGKEVYPEERLYPTVRAAVQTYERRQG